MFAKKLLIITLITTFTIFSESQKTSTDKLNQQLLKEIQNPYPNIKKITNLLANGANPNIRNNNFNGNGATPLIMATISQNLPLVQLFLNQGAFPDLTNNAGNNPLIIATLHNSYTIAQELLNANADPNFRTEIEGYTALIIAAKNNNSQIIQLLLRHNADPNIPDFRGNLPLTEAVGHNNFNAVQALLNATNIDINLRDNIGNTALIVATIMNNFPMIQILLAADANVMIQNNKKLSALDIAIKNNNTKIIQALKQSNQS
ncbi:ankyrin repeat domain-containing protein [Candidatus Dependentiae bacterium]|nr:ankyrin repeat domain-containing protein [Candidatus Dependentiae bacterium]